MMKCVLLCKIPLAQDASESHKYSGSLTVPEQGCHLLNGFLSQMTPCRDSAGAYSEVGETWWRQKDGPRSLGRSPWVGR